MKVYAISDLHLSINNPKPMDIFGPAWDGYIDKIFNDWKEKVSDDDIVLIPGDISWAMHLSDAKPDLDLICNLKGHKLMIKGNHDYWWSSLSNVRKSLYNNTFVIQNDAIKIGKFIIGGSRGWLLPDSSEFRADNDEKIYKRELIRMELSLKSMNALKEDGDELIFMTHFPPYNNKGDDSDVTRLFEKYQVNSVVFGHLHSYDRNQNSKIEKNGIDYYLCSCDLVDNKLVEIY